MLWGHLYGVLLVGEPETLAAVGGSALIALGVISLSLRPSPKEGDACTPSPAQGAPALLSGQARGAPAELAAGAAAAAAALPPPCAPAPKAAAEHDSGRGWAVRAWLPAKLGRRLRAWAAGRRGGVRAHAEPGDDGAEAEGLTASAGAKPVPTGLGVLEGHWAGMAEAESPRHVTLLVPAGR